MYLTEISCHVDVGTGIWSGCAHCQNPMNPREFRETIDYAGALLSEFCHRQCLYLSQVQEVQISVLRVEAVEAAGLPSRLDQMPITLPGHRRATGCSWEFIARGEMGVVDGHRT